MIALSDQLILLHVRGIESSIFIDCFLFKAVQKYIKPLKDRQKTGGFYIFVKNVIGKQYQKKIAPFLKDAIRLHKCTKDPII